MRQVKSLVEREGFEYLLSPRPLVNVKPVQGDLFCEYISQMLSDTERKVLIVPDTDIDGYLSAKIVYDMCLALGVESPRVYLHSVSHHGITSAMTIWMLQKKFTHVIIVDSSSNEIENLGMLCINGVRVCVIDHHVVNYTRDHYHKNCLVLNHIQHMAEGYKLPYKSASCGLLCALYCNYVLSKYMRSLPNDDWTYAAVTLYSDCMDTLDPFNVSVLSAVRNNNLLPHILQGISGKKSRIFNREVINYSINPKMNTCLRLERFDLLYKLFFKPPFTEIESKIYEIINELNKELKEILSTLEQELPVDIVKDITLVNMSGQSQSIYTNFKGLIANKIGEQTGNLTIGYYIVGKRIYASVRDPVGRDILKIFKEYCQADGHPSAFGFQIPEKHFEGLIDYVQRSLDEIDKKPKKPIIIGENEYNLDEEGIQQLSIINEYTTVNRVLVRIKLNPEKYVIRSSRYGYQVTSSALRMFSSIPISYGNIVLAMPVYGQGSKLQIKTIGG